MNESMFVSIYLFTIYLSIYPWPSRRFPPTAYVQPPRQ